MQKRFKRPLIYGPTSNQERTAVLSAFKHNADVKTVFISRVHPTCSVIHTNTSRLVITRLIYLKQMLSFK